ncbi:hypothetical protein E2C01_033305 [Portunus trituberculatus]|uniref:Uncharacterized protein n=1 Tax=Portunus trituberculatus TaxID=210409 RepID=A0A5B7F2L7_PORTR|nr:hypothetical protein [Portunus trituberculatus]
MVQTRGLVMQGRLRQLLRVMQVFASGDMLVQQTHYEYNPVTNVAVRGGNPAAGGERGGMRADPGYKEELHGLQQNENKGKERSFE